MKIQPHEAEILLDNKYNMITQFQGENRRQAIVHHFSLDIEEEEDFFKYMEAMGYNINSPDEKLENLHLMWYEDRYKTCCKTCGCVLRTKNAQDVGYCLPCYALMMSDED